MKDKRGRIMILFSKKKIKAEKKKKKILKRIMIMKMVEKK